MFLMDVNRGDIVKKYKDYIVIIIILSLIFISILVLSKLNDDVVEIDDEITYKLESDYSSFFTVNSCIIKYVQYLSKKDTDSLLQVIDKEYLNNNGINRDNIYNYIDNLDGTYSFSSKKMYKSNTENIIKYYVYGYLKKETIDGVLDIKDTYFVVKLDEDNLTFSIMPSNNTQFSEVENG